MPDEISMQPYTSMVQPDPMKAFTGAAAMANTLQDVKLKQRTLQAQLQLADVIKQATVNGVYDPILGQKIATDGNHPYVSGDMLTRNLDAQFQQANIQGAKANAMSAVATLLSKQMIPFATGSGMPDDVRRKGMKDTGAMAVQNGFWTWDQGQQWNRQVETATPDQLAKLAVTRLQQGFTPESTQETADIQQRSGVPKQIQKAAVPAAFPPAPAGPPAPPVAPPAASRGLGAPPAPGAPAAPPASPLGSVTGYQGRSGPQIAGDKAYADYMAANADINQRITNLQDILATNGEVNMGPAAGVLYSIKQAYQQVMQGLDKKAPEAADTSAFFELQKQMAQLAGSRGGPSDYARMLAVTGGPHMEMDHTSVGMVSKLMLGIEQGRMAFMDMASRQQAEDLGNFNFFGLQSRFTKAFDPRVMAAMNMNPAEIRLMITRIAKNDPDQLADFKAHGQMMIDMGIVPKTVAKRISSAMSATPAGAQ
jgi:hypothetical protein